MFKSNLLTLLDPEQLKEFYAAGYWTEDTIYTLAAAHAERAPDSFAIRDRYRRLTYQQLIQAADAFADSLAAQGVRPGQRVAVWLSSRLENAIALLACSRNRYICSPSLHRNHTVDEVNTLMRRMSAAAVLWEQGYGADASEKDFLEQVKANNPSIVSYVLPQLDGGEAAQESLALLTTSNEAATTEGGTSPVKQPDTVVYLAFTSGTTGDPKGVMHSDNTLLANARSLSNDWSLNADSIIYTLSPLSHNLGFGAMVAALARGAELVVHDLPRGASLFERLVETEATFMFGVPVHASDLLAEMSERDATQLSRLRGFRISGAQASERIVSELLGHGIIPQSGYGMTEACSHNYTMPDDDPERVIKTSGKACPGYEIKIWSKEDPDIAVGPGQEGQIGGRGASLMLGYFDNQKETEEAFNSHGWFMTGDLGWMDEDGYLRVTGRIKDIIIRGGHNIFPGHIEELASRYPSVDKVAAIPVPDERMGEKVCLVVTLRANGEVNPDDLLAFLGDEGLSIYDMPEYFAVVDSMPLTASGKILKRTLEEQVAKGSLQPIAVRASRSNKSTAKSTAENTAEGASVQL